MPATKCWSRRSVCTWRGVSTSRATGPSSPASNTHHPALRWVPCSRTSRPVSSNTKRTSAPRGLVALGGDSRSTRPAWERWTRIRRPPSNVRTRYFPRRFTEARGAPPSSSGGGAKVFRLENPKRSVRDSVLFLRAASRRSESACISGSSGMVATDRGQCTGRSSVHGNRCATPLRWRRPVHWGTRVGGVVTEHSVDFALLVLRLTAGAVFLAHGINHVFGGGKIAGTGRWFESLGMRPGRMHAWTASLTEVGSGALLVAGLLTPMAAAGVVGVMLVAWITNHAKNGFFIFRPGEGY